MTCRLMSLITQGIPEKYTQFCCVSVSPTPSPISLYDLQNKFHALIRQGNGAESIWFLRTSLCNGVRVVPSLCKMPTSGRWRCMRAALWSQSLGPVKCCVPWSHANNGEKEQDKEKQPQKPKPPWTVVMNGGRCFTDGLQRRRWPAEKAARLPQGRGWVRGGQNTSVTEVVFL